MCQRAHQCVGRPAHIFEGGRSAQQPDNANAKQQSSPPLNALGYAAFRNVREVVASLACSTAVKPNPGPSGSATQWVGGPRAFR